MASKLTRVRNWYQIFKNVKNWNQIITHVKNWYLIVTDIGDQSVKNWNLMQNGAEKEGAVYQCEESHVCCLKFDFVRIFLKENGTNSSQCEIY